jgi:hypothetical protein
MALSPIYFRTQWEAAGDKLNRFSDANLAGIPLGPSDRTFLLEAGLPDGAAPFLSFEPPRTGALRTVAELWHLPSDLPPAFVIGSNWSGDPIANGVDGRVYSFNHDNDFMSNFIASSIAQLASLLLAYRDVVAYSQRVNGPDAILDNNIPADIRSWFREQVRQIDPAALELPSLWRAELESWETGAA